MQLPSSTRKTGPPAGAGRGEAAGRRAGGAGGEGVHYSAPAAGAPRHHPAPLQPVQRRGAGDHCCIRVRAQNTRQLCLVRCLKSAHLRWRPCRWHHDMDGSAVSRLAPALSAHSHIERFGVGVQEQRRARQAQLAGSVAAEEAQRCTFRPNAAAELAAIRALLAQDDDWLSD